MVRIFYNEKFGIVRVVDVDGKPCCVGVDLARILGFVDKHEALNEHCPLAPRRDIPRTDGSVGRYRVLDEARAILLVVASNFARKEELLAWLSVEVFDPACWNVGELKDEIKALKREIEELKAGAWVSTTTGEVRVSVPAPPCHGSTCIIFRP